MIALARGFGAKSSSIGKCPPRLVERARTIGFTSLRSMNGRSEVIRPARPSTSLRSTASMMSALDE